MERTFKTCSPSDSQVLSRLGRETFFETFAAMNDPETLAAYLDAAFNVNQLKEEINHPDSHFILLYCRNKPAGYLKINVNEAQTDFQDKEGLEIERIYLKRSFQGRGLGRLLMEKAISIAKERGKSHVWLGVWTRHKKGVSFYEHMGFEKNGSHLFMMGAEQQKDHIMRKDL